MELVISGGDVSFQTRLDLSTFPGLVKAHQSKVPHTEDCEQLGKDVIACNFERLLLSRFISKVCVWGGYAGIAGKIKKRNSLEEIQEHFRKAHDIMSRHDMSIGSALAELNHIKGLGTPSFASKHLRFLYPEFCPILDQLTAHLGYPFTPEGYEAFAKDCAAIACELTRREVSNPVSRPSGKWFCGEVDMALFAYLNGWQ